MTDLMRRAAVAIACLGLMGSARARADVIVEATGDTGFSSQFGTLNLTTGQFIQTSSLSVLAVSLTSSPDGTLYAGALDGNLYTIDGGVANRFGTVTAPVPPGGFQEGYFALAYAGSAGFYGVTPNDFVNDASLQRIAPDGSGVASVGGLGAYVTASSSLAFGPGGVLYFSATRAGSDYDNALFTVDTATGQATQVGTGYGALFGDALGLVFADGTLYGFDVAQQSMIGTINIYTIDLTTGAATATGVTVSGLPFGATLDTAVVRAVPEPSSVILAALGGIGIAARARKRR